MSSSGDLVIETRDLTRYFGRKKAVDSVNLQHALFGAACLLPVLAGGCVVELQPSGLFTVPESTVLESGVGQPDSLAYDLQPGGARTLLDSPTVRALAAGLAATDVIVYVELTSSPRIGRAATMFVVGTRERRFLRISINASVSPWDLGPLLAHELCHALEIARAPEVRDRYDLRALYQRIGRVEADNTRFESAAALDTERLVRAELYGSLRAKAARP